MKKQILLLLIFGLIGLISCQKPKIEKGTPVCVENMIIDFDKKESCDNGVNVKKYFFQGEMVYVFNPGTCGADMTSLVIDSGCDSLGFLGGISGNSEINGEDFANATFMSIVWEKQNLNN